MSDPTNLSATEIKVQDLVTLVAGLNRFLMRLSNMPAFQEAGLGLAEWSALSLIAGKGDINNRQLANALGVSPQRINQITDTLRGSGLVSASASADDARKKIINITQLGSARLTELDAKLQAKISLILRKRPGVLRRANTIVNKTLMRLVAPVQTKEMKDAKSRPDA